MSIYLPHSNNFSSPAAKTKEQSLCRILANIQHSIVQMWHEAWLWQFRPAWSWYYSTNTVVLYNYSPLDCNLIERCKVRWDSTPCVANCVEIWIKKESVYYFQFLAAWKLLRFVVSDWSESRGAPRSERTSVGWRKRYDPATIFTLCVFVLMKVYYRYIRSQQVARLVTQEKHRLHQTSPHGHLSFCTRHFYRRYPHAIASQISLGNHIGMLWRSM